MGRHLNLGQLALSQRRIPDVPPRRPCPAPRRRSSCSDGRSRDMPRCVVGQEPSELDRRERAGQRGERRNGDAWTGQGRGTMPSHASWSL